MHINIPNASCPNCGKVSCDCFENNIWTEPWDTGDSISDSSFIQTTPMYYFSVAKKNVEDLDLEELASLPAELVEVNELVIFKSNQLPSLQSWRKLGAPIIEIAQSKNKLL